MLLHLADAQSEGDEFARIDAHLVLAYCATEVGYIHNIWNRFELLEQNPVFYGPEFHQVVSRIRAAQRVPVDLAGGAPIGADLRLEILPRGKVNLS